MSEKRTLQKLDDMFGLNSLTSEEVNLPSNEATANGISELKIDSLVPFHKHTFKLYDGKRLEDMVENVKEHGVVTPIIVRPANEGKYEILSGHNRANAAKIAGMDTIPVIIKEGLSDDEATLLVITLNFNQRGFTDLSYRDRINAISQLYAITKKQGKRSDLTDDIENEDARSAAEETSSKYDLSPRMIRRYVKLSELNDQIISMLDDEILPFMAAYEIAFLNQREQQLFSDIVVTNKFKVDLKKAELLKANTGKLTEGVIFDILSGNFNKKPKQGGKSVKIKQSILNKYFDQNVKMSEIEEVIDKALETYFKTNQKEDS